MTFKQYLINEETKRNFCYMVYPEFSACLEEVQETLKEMYPEQFKEAKPQPKDDFHATIRYVRLQLGQTPDLFLEWLNTIQLPEITAFTSNFKILGDDKCLVFALDSDEIHNWFNKVNSWLTNVGNYSPSDYPTYKPHITLYEGYQGSSIPKFNQRIHRIKVKLNIHVVSDQSHKHIFEKKSELTKDKLGFGILD
jgi:hypothetical protein